MQSIKQQSVTEGVYKSIAVLWVYKVLFVQVITELEGREREQQKYFNTLDSWPYWKAALN